MSGWKPPGHDLDEAHILRMLSDRIDLKDPALAEIYRALIDLMALEFGLDEETVDRAIRAGRRRHESSGGYHHRVRQASPLSKKTLEAADRSVVYYMRIGNRVKIGVTTNLRKRLDSINPEELLAVEPGGYDLEKQRHGEYAHLRTHGEWFKLEAPLTWHIANLRGDALGESA